MSSTPTIERIRPILADEWMVVENDSRTETPNYSAGRVVEAISGLRSAISDERDSVSFNTDMLRPITEADRLDADHAASRWDD